VPAGVRSPETRPLAKAVSEGDGSTKRLDDGPTHDTLPSFERRNYELTWINKLRIAAVTALGVIVIGILAWPLVVPVDPLLPFGVDIAFGDSRSAVLAFGVGLRDISSRGLTPRD